MADSAVHALASLISCQLLDWKGKSGHVESHKTVCSTFKVWGVDEFGFWSQSGTGLFEEAEDDQSMKVQIIKSPKFAERWRKRGELARMKPFMKATQTGGNFLPTSSFVAPSAAYPHRSVRQLEFTIGTNGMRGGGYRSRVLRPC
ncbi:hypothetical protein DFH09DRAFT_1076589 [Mycena vulgaris]|nr:hypothetical protein DFH09DRAFT_1076589 [Mycena vulgaris]